VDDMLFATLLVLFDATACLGLVLLLRKYGFISSLLARKLMHISSGPFFLIHWPYLQEQGQLYSPTNTFLPRYCGMSVIGASTLTFVLVGLGIIKNENFVQSVSRTGSPSELLFGPFFYGMVHIASTLFWFDSPLGIICISIICFGDGFADIIGRRFGRHKIVWNRVKSWEGSAGFFLCSYFCNVIMLSWFSQLNYLQNITNSFMFVTLPIITFVAMLVESLPIEKYDNLTVFFACLITGKLFGL